MTRSRVVRCVGGPLDGHTRTLHEGWRIVYTDEALHDTVYGPSDDDPAVFVVLDARTHLPTRAVSGPTTEEGRTRE